MSEFDDPRLSALYRKAPSSEPTPRSDALIVEAAQKAVGSPARRRFVPWAVAATLVLGVGIGWRVLHLGPTTVARDFPQPSPAVEEAAAPPSAPSTTAGSRPAEADGDVPHETPFGGVSGNAAKRMDRLREPAAAAAAADVARGRGESPVATRLSEAGSEVGPGSRCSGYWPEGEIAVDQWHALIARARMSGDVARLRCLEARYRELFGDEPAAVTKPAPGK